MEGVKIDMGNKMEIQCAPAPEVRDSECMGLFFWVRVLIPSLWSVEWSLRCGGGESHLITSSVMLSKHSLMDYRKKGRKWTVWKLAPKCRLCMVHSLPSVNLWRNLGIPRLEPLHLHMF